MLRRMSTALAAMFLSSAGHAGSLEKPTTAYDEAIAREAKTHGVPANLVHRVVMRESRYQPGLVHHRCYGLMQIKYPTARSMGYTGSERGLLDPKINLTYAVPYLANAYKVAGGNEDRAVALFASGYYHIAKHKKLLSELRTASSEPVDRPAPHAPAPQPTPVANLLSFLAGSSPVASASAGIDPGTTGTINSVSASEASPRQ